MLKMRFLFIVLLSCFYGNAQYSIPTDYFKSPLDIPMVLSGTFGEFRSNHFHAGIDIKTRGVEGFEVKASAEGYISRIRVSEYGYGKAVYISHPNGYQTVYAHLQKFAPEIEKYIGHRIPTGSFAAGDLPKITQPPYRPRRRPGRHVKATGKPQGPGHAKKKSRPRRRSRGPAPKSD